MDTVNTVTCNKQNLMPKLRKNRRIETKWGVNYYTAVKNAVFVIQAPSYVPKEPPLSLKEHGSECETLLMCAQCKDCFHFRNSLEDHISRKSWILGYWCQHCFLTTCGHSPKEGLLCSACVQLERNKRSYLRSRGLHKSQKFGAIRIFYNQCQFFAHLRVHNVNVVDMGDLMLMPLPTNVNHEWNPEIDTTLEALMEHTFIMKVHIMDWLKENSIDSYWWQLAASESEKGSDLISLVLKGYKGKFYFKPLEIPIEEQFSTFNSSYSTPNSNCTYSNVDITDSLERKRSPSMDKDVIENEDNPCISNDIAFVDCGPASKHFEPETLLSSNTKKHTTAFAKSLQNNFIANMVATKSKKNRASDSKCISPDMVMSYGNTMITPKLNNKRKRTLPVIVTAKSNTLKTDSKKKSNRTIQENILSTDTLSKESDLSSSVIVADSNKLDKLKQSMHTLTVNSGQKIFTFQSAKHVDINTIINQLPSHIINNKKIVFIGQDSNVITINNKQESSSKKVVQLVPDTSVEKDSKVSPIKAVVPFGTSNELPNKNSNKAIKGLPSKRVVQLVAEAGLENDTKTSQKKPAIPLHSSKELPNKNSSKTTLKNQIGSTKSTARSFPGKVIYQNGRKYIIKQSTTTKNSKNVSNTIMSAKGRVELKSVNNIPPLIPINRTELENISNQERMNSLQGDVSPLTPSPSPSELSSSSSCDIQSKQSFSMMKGNQKIEGTHPNVEHIDVNINAQNQNNTCETLSFYKGDDENLYLDVKFLNQKLVHTIADSFTMITKCKQEMLNEFFHLPYPELMKRYEHLQQISDEVLRVMNFVDDNVVKENLKAVDILKHVLKHCIDKCSEKIDDTNEDTPLHEWESEFERTEEKFICKTCNKIMKPNSYIPGFSKLPKNDLYCSCYRHVCHKCHIYQGNSMRFVTHQTFHKKEKPYLCPDCYRKFTAFKSLEAHTWTICFHTLKKRVLGCKICEINGFQDMESIARHFGIMHSHNKIACDKCYVVLPSYSAYRKHHREKHPNSDDLLPIRLVLCKLGQCIVRCEEYMLHMEKHPVVQRLIWFKCPFCTFVNAEAKQVMSHLQGEHLSRLKELISPEVLWNVLPADVPNTSPSQSKFVNTKAEAEEDGTIMPKIINARTITSEVFERGTQAADDDLTYDAQGSLKLVNVKAEPSQQSSKMIPKILDVRSIADLTLSDSKSMNDEATKKHIKMDSEEINTISSAWGKQPIKSEPDEMCIEDSLSKFEQDESISDSLKNKLVLYEKTKDVEYIDTQNVQYRSISRPPPLARIPQHVLESNRPKVLEQSTRTGKTTVFSRNQRSVKRPQRLALDCAPNEIFNFSCHLCKEQINTSQAVILDHFRRRHSQDCKLSIVTPRLLRISSEFINGGYKDLLGSRKRKSDSGSSNSKRRRRWTPKKHSDSKNANFAGLGLCVKQVTAEDSEGNFICKKCDQRCTDMTNLREHIASNHRIRGRCLVCLECGDNFVVAPSLQMHLKAFHGIEDPITYMAQNTSYAPDNVDDLEAEGKSIEANQCHVCMAVFEDKAAVDKHLRVHGMAFLNRKRIEARNALKSPEKKNETEEKTETSVKVSSKKSVQKDKPAETILEKISATI
ncbi:uncharacterized protein LOC100877784 [Megachile rotundata]|uniref:uncharacterized protein LOC100877784 n=1 Tax=Megachile rotundata TaxID=143995 RepID=UPI003FD47E91